MNRRDFLKTTLAVVPAASLVHAAEKGEKKDEWAAVRDQFQLNRDKVHTALFFLASHPKVVRDAIEKHRAGLDADPYAYVEDLLEHGENDIRRAAAEYLDVQADDVALTDSTTMGLGLVYGCLKLEPGQEVVVTAHDHYSALTALANRTARDGITVKNIALYEPAAPEAATAAKMVEAVTKAVTPKTRVVGITWVHSCTGVKTPVRAIADALAKLNEKRAAGDRVLLVVDGVHGLGAEDTSLPKLGCDVFISGTHKWLFGPRGTGIVWAKPDVWPLMQPLIPTFSGDAYPMWMEVIPKAPLKPALQMTPGGFHSFEHRLALIDAFKWHAGLGKAKVAARVHALNRQFKEGLAKVKGVKLHTPLSDELSAGITTFDVGTLGQPEVAKRLAAQNIIATVTPYRSPRFARVSFGILNTPEDVDAVVKAVKSIAATA